MTTEQKAKAYDEAIERASKLRVQNPFDTVSQMMEHVFPELCESEDERIRKELIEHVKDQQSSFISAPDCRDKYEEEENNKYNSWLSWLEKQGTSYTKKDVDDAFVEGMAFAKNELEKQGEKKPIDKIQLGKKYKCIASPRYSTFRRGNIYKPVDNFLCNLMNLCYECFEPIEDSEQKPTDEDMKEALRTEYEKGRADAIAQIQKKWSNKEKLMLNDIIEATERSNIFMEDYQRELIDWLKSLKERYFWKPETWEILILESVIEKGENPKNYSATLHSILEQLKKLKGE